MKTLFIWILLFSFDIIGPMSLVYAAEGPGYDAHGKRDPFVALVTSTTKQSTSLLNIENIEDLSIEGIVYDARQGSMVIVNGAVLREGEQNGPVKVTKIAANGAYFEVNGVEGFKPTFEEKNSNKKENE